MTHLRSKRSLKSGAGRTPAAVGLVAALALGTVGEAQAAPAAEKGPPGAPGRAHGFASLAGGAGGEVVTVTDRAAPAKYAAAREPYVVRMAGSITAAPFGSDIRQRDPSADNRAYAHLYDNHLSGQVADGGPPWTYGNRARGATRMVIENSYCDGVRHPYQADATAEPVQRGPVPKDTTGRHDAWGDAFEPGDFYDHRLDPAAAVPAPVERFSGPRKQPGTH
ncbi:hypothetical protein [Streptomyces sp. NPDC017260]|uniref:hypothetical protein n=1 Tax=unclassified Streptomyces TaxID=2593676 RepID=UPI0037A262D9